jgi:transposase
MSSKKRRGMLRRGVKFLSYNAPFHTATVAKAEVRECGLIILDHPPFSPVLDPSCKTELGLKGEEI